ncbi:MAG: transposase [Actinobacteria bacterium]|nr:transposase [Actinomycetota bacterium]MCG2820083.1 transposase [Actinomycetes bacterium]MBU4179567.1 transposase [Actinomycetota bacterium]MBU4218982.1 transposase [Actinomycetota bacterium]MBU4359170.1 transposase [Actinomycetota bacterium]
MSRGNSKQAVFLSDDDRFDFIGKLSDVVSEFGWGCYAYCLMNNHYHLFIETPQANLSEGMHMLLNYYCKRFNWRYDRVGHVMQGRFTSRLIEREEHLMEVIRYTALNPVKGGLVSKPGQWRWSSYRAISGIAPAPEFLDVEYTLRIFGNDNEMAQKEYLRFVAEGLLMDQKDRISLPDLFRGVVGKQQINKAIRIARYEQQYTAKEIAAYLGISRSTVTRASRQ